MRKEWWVGLCLLGWAGCAAPNGWITFPDGGGSKGMAMEEWLKAHPMDPSQEISILEISRGDSGSSHIVQIRTREPLHVHARHDLIAILLKGRGTLTLGSRRLELKPGAIVSIPRGVPHAFENTGSEPAAAYAAFFPAFDGVDTVPSKEESTKKKP